MLESTPWFLKSWSHSQQCNWHNQDNIETPNCCKMSSLNDQIRHSIGIEENFVFYMKKLKMFNALKFVSLYLLCIIITWMNEMLRECVSVCVWGGDIVVGRGVMHTGAGRVITEGELPSSTAVVGPSVDVWVVWWIQGPIAAPRPCWPMHQRGPFSLLTSLTFSPLLLASNHKSPKL